MLNLLQNQENYWCTKRQYNVQSEPGWTLVI